MVVIIISDNNQIKKYLEDDQETVECRVMEDLKFLGIRFEKKRASYGQGGIVETGSDDEAWNKPNNNNNNNN